MNPKPPGAIDPRAIRIKRNQAQADTPSEKGDGEGVKSAEPPPEAAPEPAKPPKSAPPSVFERFSVRDKMDEVEAAQVKAEKLFLFIHAGQLTILYSESNAGKTLIVLWLVLRAIEAGAVDPNRVFYVNADDNSEGAAQKGRLLQEAGAHLVLPGWQGFKTRDLIELLDREVALGTARGTVIILDTVKKFADPMSKAENRRFGDACRRFSMAGGTIIALAHTAKNYDADGWPRYQGTTDLKEDFDAAYIGKRVISKDGSHAGGVLFRREKARGNSPELVAFVFDADERISYEERLASVQNVDPDAVEGFVIKKEKYSEPEVMDAFVQLIGGGSQLGKMALAKAVAERTGVSQRTALGVLERYTGTVPREHLWTARRGPRNVQIYALIDQSRPAD